MKSEQLSTADSHLVADRGLHPELRMFQLLSSGPSILPIELIFKICSEVWIHSHRLFVQFWLTSPPAVEERSIPTALSVHHTERDCRAPGLEGDQVDQSSHQGRRMPNQASRDCVQKSSGDHLHNPPRHRSDPRALWLARSRKDRALQEPRGLFAAVS